MTPSHASQVVNDRPKPDVNGVTVSGVDGISWNLATADNGVNGSQARIDF